MNVDKSSDRNNLSSCVVRSKYFLDPPVMDESLSDFKEKKKNCGGPKKSETHKSSTSKPKKRLKRIKGQKDIRTALKNKNELVAFSNDFQKVCKQSGINIDSEELQLAIALSKSVQNSETVLQAENDPRSLSSQERVGKIRTTLQEYGFKVPDIKIAKNKKLKNRNNYKLLSITETERQQLISTRYSEVLFGHVNISNVEVHLEDFAYSLYKIATDVSFEVLKSNNIFCVSNLITKESVSTVGSLLKDWAEIPGRPLSPNFKKSTEFNFIDMKVTPSNLDILLSGSLKCAQDIIKNISSSTLPKETDNNINMDKIKLRKSVGANNSLKTVSIEIDLTVADDNLNINRNTETNQLNISQKPQEIRSTSPDMFDDEVSCIMNSSKSNYEVSQKSTCVTQATSVCMDLTECVDTCKSSITHNILNVDKPLSQKGNATERRSNDFMEITGCISTSRDNSATAIMGIQDHIDLTQSSKDTASAPTVEIHNEPNDFETTDLTQTSDSDNSLPLVYISGKQNDSLDATVLINKENYIDDVDLNQPGTVNKEFNIVFNSFDLCSNTNNVELTNSPIDDNNVNNVSSYASAKIVERRSNTILLDSDEESEDLSEVGAKDQSSGIELEIKDNVSVLETNKNNKTKTESFFEEYVHQHSSDGSKEEAKSDLTDDSVNKSDVSIKIPDANLNNEIDLTQSSGTSDIALENSSTNIIEKDTNGTDCLGKIGGVSIDYDDLFDDVIDTYSSKVKPSNTTSESTSINANDNNSSSSNVCKSVNTMSNSSDNNEVFEISDNELNYSLCRSRNDVAVNFDHDEVLVLQNISTNDRQRNSSSNMQKTNLNELKDDSYLPAVEFRAANSTSNTEKYSQSKFYKTEASTPFKLIDRGKSLNTPDDGEYDIRTDQVTPMINYSSLTTPERNKELDKYGLKPFKRKRAIQLLTHLYNQTHPIVEACSIEDQGSPSKKLKTNHHAQPSPKKLLKSPTKKAKSQAKSSELSEIVANGIENQDKYASESIEALSNDDESSIYKITTEVPVIKNIDCCEQDWVFQKREKAKMHSSRVPLHVSFHNYVSARQLLRNAILRYEPVNIDDIHKGLVASGYRYDPKDLLRFLDKKCITVKTATKENRNKRHY